MPKIKILLNCPIPVEFKAARNILLLNDSVKLNGCKIAERIMKKTHIIAIQSGPGKTRAAQAVGSAIISLQPDIVLDTGTCAGLEPGLTVGNIILGKKCIEFDISGFGIPNKRIKEMELVSCFHFYSSEKRDMLLQSAANYAKNEGYNVFFGYQACGEYFINSSVLRDKLYSLFHVSGSNWETAGVFVCALRSQIPVLSLRVISDMGNKNAILEFKANAKKCALDLYQYIKILSETGWLHSVVDEWKSLSDSVRQKSPNTVLP